MQHTFGAALLTFIGLVMIGLRSLAPPQIGSFAVMAIGLGVVAWLGNRKPIAKGVWIGAGLYILLAGGLYYVGGPDVLTDLDMRRVFE